MDEHEYLDFEETLYELLDDIVRWDSLLFSDPDAHDIIIDDLFDLFYSEWLDAGILDSDENEDFIYDAIAEIADTFFQLYACPRSSLDTHVVTSYAGIDVANRLEQLKNAPQPAQKTLEWHLYRHDLMTASNIWKVFSTESQRNSLIYEKCKPFNPDVNRNNWHATGSLQWGVLYEPISIQLYETIFNTKVGDFGCLPHPQYKCIGASPDGINIDPTSDRYGRMLEVKNIVNREITGIPKEEYWIQMQVQMETCDLDDCDFLETRFKEYATEDEFKADEAHEWKGIILCFIQRNVINSKPTYRYSPLDGSYDVESWMNGVKESAKSEDLILFTTTHWYLDQLSCVYVQRNRAWFAAGLPLILDTWATIEKERETGYEHRAANKRNTSDIFISTGTGLGGDETHTIHNMKIPQNICLIKLD
jgi:hypothetical protein